jgi:predicted nuclease of predicted toxin-antitoxin system
MRFLIDANLRRSIVELIVRLGHEADFARDIGLGAAPDRVIAANAQATRAALLSRDLDFADVRIIRLNSTTGLLSSASAMMSSRRIS